MASMIDVYNYAQTLADALASSKQTFEQITGVVEGDATFDTTKLANYLNSLYSRTSGERKQYFERYLDLITKHPEILASIFLNETDWGLSSPNIGQIQPSVIKTLVDYPLYSEFLADVMGDLPITQKLTLKEAIQKLNNARYKGDFETYTSLKKQIVQVLSKEIKQPTIKDPTKWAALTLGALFYKAYDETSLLKMDKVYQGDPENRDKYLSLLLTDIWHDASEQEYKQFKQAIESQQTLPEDSVKEFVWSKLNSQAAGTVNRAPAYLALLKVPSDSFFQTYITSPAFKQVYELHDTFKTLINNLSPIETDTGELLDVTKTVTTPPLDVSNKQQKTEDLIVTDLSDITPVLNQPPEFSFAAPKNQNVQVDQTLYTFTPEAGNTTTDTMNVPAEGLTIGGTSPQPEPEPEPEPEPAPKPPTPDVRTSASQPMWEKRPGADAFNKGFMEGLTGGWKTIDEVNVTPDTQDAYAVGSTIGATIRNFGLAFLGSGILGTILSAPAISAALGKLPAALEWAVTGAAQGTTYIILNNLTAADPYDIPLKDVPATLVDFGSGEVFRGVVSNLLKSFSPIARQVLSSLSDHLGGTLAGAAWQGMTEQDWDVFYKNIGPAALAGFVVENVFWGVKYNSQFKETLNALGADVKQLETVYNKYLEDPNPKNLQQLQTEIDNFLVKFTLTVGHGDPAAASKTFKALVSSNGVEILDKVYKNSNVDIPKDVLEYLVNTPPDKFDSAEFLKKLNASLSKDKPQTPEEKLTGQTGIEQKVEEAKVEEIKPEEAKIEEAKVEEVKPEEAKVKEVKGEAVKPEEAKIEEAKVEEVKPEEAKVEEVKTEEVDTKLSWLKNNLTKDALLKIPGIGESKASRILDMINSGEIKSLEDFKKVPGIGEKLYKNITEFIQDSIKQQDNVKQAFTLPEDEDILGSLNDRAHVENDLFTHPKTIYIGENKYVIDVGDPLIDDALKIIELEKAAKNLDPKDPNAQTIKDYVDEAKYQLAEKLGVDRTHLDGFLKELDATYKTEIEERLKNIDEPDTISKLEFDVSNKFILKVNDLLQKYFHDALVRSALDFLVTPQTKFEELKLNYLTFNMNVPIDLKSPANTTRILGSETMKKILLNVAQAVEDLDIEPRTLDETAKKAQEIAHELGLSQEEVKQMIAITKRMPEVATAIRALAARYAQIVDDLAKRIQQEALDYGKPNATTIQKFYHALKLLYAFTSDYKQLYRTASDVLNSGRIVVDGQDTHILDVTDPKILEQMEILLRGSDINWDNQAYTALKLAQQILQSKDLASKARVAKSQYSKWRRFSDALLEFRIANVLTTTTHVTNFISQIFNAGFDVTKEALKYAFAHLTNADPKTKAAIRGRLFGYWEGFKAIFTNPIVTRKELYTLHYGRLPSTWDLIKLRLFNPKAYELVMKGLDTTTKVGIEWHKRALDSTILRFSSDQPLLHAVSGLFDFAMSHLRLFSFGGLALGDRPYKRLYYEAGVRAVLEEMKEVNPKLDVDSLYNRVLLYRKFTQMYSSLKQAQPTLKDSEIVKRVTDMVGKNVLEWKDLGFIRKIDEAGLREAAKGTWQDPINNKVFAQLEKFINSTPGLKFLIPFTHTPTKLLEKFLYSTGLSKEFWNDLRGKNGQEKMFEAAASLMITSLTYLLGWGAYKAGLLIPPAASKSEEQYLLSLGIQPESIKIGDKFVSFTRFDPYPSYYLTLIGSLVKVVDSWDKLPPGAHNLEEAAQLFAGLVSLNLKAITDKTYFRTLSETLDFIRGNDLTSLPKSLASSLVPYQNIYRSLRYSDIFGLNPFKAETLTAFRKEGKTYPKLNIFGEPITPYDTFLGARTTQLSEDLLDRELLRLYLTTNYKISGLGKTAWGVPLDKTTQYKLYQFMANIKAKERLRALIMSPAYQNAVSDEERATMLEKAWATLKRAARINLLRDAEFITLKQAYEQRLKQVQTGALIPFAKILEREINRAMGGQ